MHWIALDDKRPIAATLAVKQRRYLCPECAAEVRVRSGPHRQAHFYHLRAPSHCRQHKKTEEHLRLQLLLASLLPPQEATIERSFPEINRIADVAWEQGKIVFEIQCSPIALEEVQQRCCDYRSMGWEILWILSDKKFNRRKLSASEAFLRRSTCYFFQYKGAVYDQCEILKGFRRTHKGPPLKINPVSLAPHNPHITPSFPLPLFLQQRWKSWKLRAEGDLLTRALEQSEPAWAKKWIGLESEARPEERRPLLPILKKCYTHLLNKLLRLFTLKSE